MRAVYAGAEFYTLDFADKHLCLCVFGRNNKKQLEEIARVGFDEEKIDLKIKKVNLNFWNVACTGLAGTGKYQLYVIGQ